MYSLVDDFSHFFGRHYRSHDDEAGGGPGGGRREAHPAPSRPREPEPAEVYRGVVHPLGRPDLRPLTE
jgi:hypothetical protein